MNLHEFQSKELFRQAGINVPNGIVINSLSQINDMFINLSPPLMIKAQILTGGRGKAGLIKRADKQEDVIRYTKNLLGKRVKTKQTGSEFLVVKQILIETCITITSELYVSIITDRTKNCPMLIISKIGGVDIENTAKIIPDVIHTIPININLGITDHICHSVHYLLTDELLSLKETSIFIRQLYKVYIDNDATMVEINPAAITEDRKIYAVDAKINVDNNARYRHKEWTIFEKSINHNHFEKEAIKFGLNYIKLKDGTIGCMVNGAGLAMATMDVIALFNAKPANFLDVGGGATIENITAAFRILTSDRDVKAILVNIFGGIMKCDIIAQGIVSALKSIQLDVPLVVRLEGTNSIEGKYIILNSGIPCEFAEDLSDAAQRAVYLSGNR